MNCCKILLKYIFCTISVWIILEAFAFLPYDPIEKLSPQEQAQQAGYPTEFHELYSESGHQLSLLRLQKKNQGKIINPIEQIYKFRDNNEKDRQTELKPVLFVHGLTCDMSVFFSDTDEKSIPYTLADMGYDVFVLNWRGTSKTQKHQNETISSQEFWDFSIDEIANQDLPQFVEFVGQLSNQKVDLVTISLGGTVTLLSLADQNPILEKYIDRAIMLAPGMQSWNVWLVNFFKITRLADIANYFGIYIYPSTSFAYHSAHLTPLAFKKTMKLFLEGEGSYNFMQARKQLVSFPSSTSMKVFQHMVQLSEAKQIQRFDYGPQKNLEIYGQEQPLIYDFSKVRKGKIYYFYGLQDILVPAEDAKWMKKQCYNADLTLLEYPNQGHCSFMASTDNDFYDKIKEIMTDHNKQKIISDN